MLSVYQSAPIQMERNRLHLCVGNQNENALDTMQKNHTNKNTVSLAKCFPFNLFVCLFFLVVLHFLSVCFGWSLLINEFYRFSTLFRFLNQENLIFPQNVRLLKQSEGQNFYITPRRKRFRATLHQFHEFAFRKNESLSFEKFLVCNNVSFGKTSAAQNGG